MKRKITVLSGLLFFAFFAVAQHWEIVDHSELEPDAAWETNYQDRVASLLTADDCTGRSNRGDTDNGKRYWPLCLCDIYKNRDNPTEFQDLIVNESNGGHSGIYGTYEGSFYKPFSCPGYVKYYLTFYDDITSYDPDQHTKVSDMWTEPNKGFTMREDGSMDPIYNCSEMNSENFHWMSRIGGYILSHHLDDPDTTYFQDWIKGWVRGTYNIGRTEWNAHNYSGWCIISADNVYQFGHKNEYKEMGRAVNDWIAMEFSIKHLNGHDVGPDSRNKSSGYERYTDSWGPFSYLWFSDHSKNIPSDMNASQVADVYGDNGAAWTIGHLPYFDFRPPQAIVDIAQGVYEKPVEIHSTKPFYQSDEDNYEHWAGGTEITRKFEYQTAYIHDNYLLSSLASGRPYSQHDFIELRAWEIGVNELNYSIFGDCGNGTSGYGLSGRENDEQIAQLKNVMILLYQGSVEEDKSWMAIPNSDAGLVAYEWDGDKLFCDLGNDVYMAVIPHNVTGHEFIDTLNAGSYPFYHRVEWHFPSPTDLSALVVEMGTAEDHGSFTDFKSNINSNTTLTSPATSQIEYTSTQGDVLKMEFQDAPSDYIWTQHNCNIDTIPAAEVGYYPIVWYNGVENDYSLWEQYEVTHGPRILHSNWRDGVITIASDSNACRITIDTATAEVTYEKWEGPIDREAIFEDVLVEDKIIQQDKQSAVSVYPNPSDAGFYLKVSDDFVNASVSVYNINGIKVDQYLVNSNLFEFGHNLSPGIYILKIATQEELLQKKIIKK
jgi:hypothetical protein